MLYNTMVFENRQGFRSKKTDPGNISIHPQ